MSKKASAVTALVFILMTATLFTACGSKPAENAVTDKPTAVSTPDTSVGGETEVPDLCKNEYVPVGPKVKRQYRIAYPKNMIPAAEYTERFEEFKDNTFFAVTELSGVSTRLNWRCTEEGLFATQYNNSVDMKSAGSANLETLDSSGITFPANGKWNAGEKWSAEYRVKQTLKSPSGQVTGTGTGKVTQSGEMIGIEDVTTPAGKFPAMKIKIHTVIDMIMEIAGSRAPIDMELDTFAWFVKNKGMVKSSTNLGHDGNVDTLLLSNEDK